MALVRCTGIFTQTATRLSASDEGRCLIKSSRLELRSINHLKIERMFGGIVQSRVLRSYYDLAVESAEQIEVFMFDIDVEKRLR